MIARPIRSGGNALFLSRKKAFDNQIAENGAHWSVWDIFLVNVHAEAVFGRHHRILLVGTARDNEGSIFCCTTTASAMTNSGTICYAFLLGPKRLQFGPDKS